MKKFLALYEEENKDELTIETFTETIDRLKEVFNAAEPVQTGAVMLCDIIKKIVDKAEDQQTLIDDFQNELEDVLSAVEEPEDGEDTDEFTMDFDAKFDEMNDIDIDSPEDSTEAPEEDDGYALDDVEKNSKEEKFSNLKKVTGAKKSDKDKKEESDEEETK
jgi:hypothetical protein